MNSIKRSYRQVVPKPVGIPESRRLNRTDSLDSFQEILWGSSSSRVLPCDLCNFEAEFGYHCLEL